MLSSDLLREKIAIRDCDACKLLDILYQMSLHQHYNPNDDTVASSKQLKNLIARQQRKFNNSLQHDPAEFLEALINSCPTLQHMTKSKFEVTHKCDTCGNVPEIKIEYQNILSEAIDSHDTADNTTKDILTACIDREAQVQKTCSSCLDNETASTGRVFAEKKVISKR